MSALRRSCPGTLIGVSTGAWIEADEARTLDAIAGWSDLPDYASVNFEEPGALAVMERLRERGIGIEAGLASLADAEALVRCSGRQRIFRILVEISEQDLGEALDVVGGIVAILHRAELRRPILAHGQDATVWPLVALAAERRWSTRVGLEDGRQLADGSVTQENAAMVRDAVSIFRSGLSARS